MSVKFVLVPVYKRAVIVRQFCNFGFRVGPIKANFAIMFLLI